MKRRVLSWMVFIAIVFTVNLFTSCERKEGPELPIPDNDSITMGAGYLNDIYYSMTTGVVAEVPRAEWDIAFAVDAQSSAVLINEASGVELKVYPTQEGWNWSDAVNISEYDTWDNLLNPDTTWTDGAFGMNATGHPNYGWGVYNMANHNIEGVALYIIKTRSGSMMKIFLEMKYSTEQRYTFKFADLDTKAEYSVDLDCSASAANFVYYSLEDNMRLNREPDSDTWDLLFTKYIDNTIERSVTGALSNANVMVVEKDGDTMDGLSWTEDEYSDDINTIGYDWKTIRQDYSAYDVDEDRVYVVKDELGNEFLLQFTGFDMTIGKSVFKKLEK